MSWKKSGKCIRNKHMSKIKMFFKRPRNIIFLVILVLVVAGIWGLAHKKTVLAQAVTVKNGNIQQIVSVTGRVKPQQDLNLTFEKSGRLVAVNVVAGANVVPGQVLMQIDTSELRAQAANASASVQSAQAKLDQQMAGATQQDLNVSQTSLDNSKHALIESMKTAMNSNIDAMVTLTSLQSKYFSNQSSFDYGTLAGKKAAALESIYGPKPNLGWAGSWYFLGLNSGLKSEVSGLTDSAAAADVLAVLGKVQNALTLARDALDMAYSLSNSITVTVTDADKTSLTTARGNILGQSVALVTAENTMKAAQTQFDLKKAPATTYDIEVAQSALKQAQANLDLINAQISKNILRSPIAGVVGDVKGNKGEMATPGQTAVTVIGKTKFQIEANIPEADIAKVHVGDIANLTVDAYGSDVLWQSNVINIYPSEEIIDGVATYKTVFQLTREDERIRSGMTANLDILSAQKDNVILIPQRAVINRGGKRFARIVIVADGDHQKERLANMSLVSKDKNSAVYETAIETGLRGSDGNVEVVSGLKAGDKVVTE